VINKPEKKRKSVCSYQLRKLVTVEFACSPPQVVEWADPGGTAIPGQPVEKPEQAPASSPRSKNQFNIEVSTRETYQILS